MPNTQLAQYSSSSIDDRSSTPDGQKRDFYSPPRPDRP